MILWDMIETIPSREYKSHTKGVLSLAFNQEYRLLFSAGFDHDIYVWNPYIGNVAFTIEGHNSSLVGVKVIPDSPQVISADIDGWVKVWDIRNLSCAQTFNLEEKQSGFRFALSDFTYLQHHQRLVFGGKGINFYDYDKNHNPFLVDDNLPLASYYTPTYHKILTPISNKVKVWNALTAVPETLYAPSAESEISCVEMDEWEKRIIVGDIKGHTRVYNIKNGALMKSLADHRGEINCISCSETLQIIATGALDMSILLHQDKLLTETAVLKLISLSALVTVLRLVPYLDILATGNSEGFVSVWDIQDACFDGVPMGHQGEILAIQVIPVYPLIVVCDSSAEIAMWALHPLPYKYNRILSLINHDPGNLITAVQATSYYPQDKILFIGDEKGYIKAYSLEEVIRILGIGMMSAKPKDNKASSFASRAHLNAPTIPPSALRLIYCFKVHSEGIRHLFLIREPLSLISTGYDRRTKLVDAKSGAVVGALYQGISFLKNRGGKKDAEDMIPWNFFLDVDSLEARDKFELEDMYEKIKHMENTRKSIIVASLHFKGLGASFIEPHYPNRQSKILEPEDYEKQFKPVSPKGLIGRNFEKQVMKPKDDFLLIDIKEPGLSQSKMKERLDINRIQKKSQHTRKEFVNPQKGLTKVPSLPSIIQAYRADSLNMVRDVRKKLSKAAYNSAVKLSKALDELYF